MFPVVAAAEIRKGCDEQASWIMAATYQDCFTVSRAAKAGLPIWAVIGPPWPQLQPEGFADLLQEGRNLHARITGTQCLKRDVTAVAGAVHDRLDLRQVC